MNGAEFAAALFLIPVALMVVGLVFAVIPDFVWHTFWVLTLAALVISFVTGVNIAVELAELFGAYSK